MTDTFDLVVLPGPQSPLRSSPHSLGTHCMIMISHRRGVPCCRGQTGGDAPIFRRPLAANQVISAGLAHVCP